MKVLNRLFNTSLQDILDKLSYDLYDIGYSLGRTKDRGKDIAIICPFHSDSNPSLNISKENGVCHCFACNSSTSLPKLIGKLLTSKENAQRGMQWLMKNFESEVIIGSNYTYTSKEKEIEYVTEEELDSYRYTHPYMYERHLTDDIIELFDIGYDKSTKCITFPNKDIYGNCVFVAKRSVRTKFFNYPSDVDKPIYGLYEYNNSISVDSNNGNIEYFHLNNWMTYDPLVLFICESMLDALRLWSWGYYAVALNGIGSSSQIELLNALPIHEIRLCLDMDKPGIKARQRLKSVLKYKHVKEVIWDVNVAKDIGEMPNKEFFERALKRR